MDDNEKTPGPTTGVEPSLSVSVSVSGEDTARRVNPDYLERGLVVGGSWQIEEKVGAGGMGAVYRVRNTETSKHFALKISLAPTEESDAEQFSRVTRFKRESALVLMLEHPNVLPPLAYFRWPDPEIGHPCMVMPFVQGEQLSKHCRTHSPSLRRLLEGLLRPIADALDYVHSKTVIHRDVKPANILVREDGVPLLVDFGIARADSSATATAAGELLATFEFSSPEFLLYTASPSRANGDEFEYTPGHDLFCLGAAFFEILTGRLPYHHVEGAETEGYLSPTFLGSVRNFQPQRCSAFNPQVPEDVDEFFLRLMASSPTERFQRGGEVVTAIDHLLLAHPRPDPVFDGPFQCPSRVRTPKPIGDKKRVPTQPGPPTPPISALKPATVPTPGRVQGGPRTLAPPSVAASASPVAPPSLAFRQPTAARGVAFEAPLPPAPAHASVDAVDDGLNTGIRRLQQELGASSPAPASKMMRAAVAGLAGLVLLLLVVVLATSQRPTAPSPQSLIDAPPEVGAKSSAVVPPSPLLVPLPTAVSSAPADDAGVVVVTGKTATTSVRKGRSTDAAAIDAMLKSEYGGERPVLGGEKKGSKKPALEEPSGVLVGAETDDPEAVDEGPKPVGVPMGTEIAVRLQKPLDSRTVTSGPAIARLMRPLVVRGAVVLSAGTMAFGTAGATAAGRFDIRFTRLRTPDGREVAFQGIAYDSDDKKPGLRAQRITSVGARPSGLGEQLAKGTAGTILGKAPGGDVADVVKGAGQTVLGQSGESGGGGADALTLEAPADFVVFVGEAF